MGKEKTGAAVKPLIKTDPWPVRLTPEQDEQVNGLVKKFGRSKAAVLRAAFAHSLPLFVSGKVSVEELIRQEVSEKTAH